MMCCKKIQIYINDRPLQIMQAFFEHFSDRWAFEHNASIIVEFFKICSIKAKIMTDIQK